MGMEFLYFPEDKSEYLPGIISVIVIILLSALIFRLLMRASKREVEKLEQQGFPASSQSREDRSSAGHQETSQPGQSADKIERSSGERTPPEK